MDVYRTGRGAGSRFLAVPEILVEADAVNKASQSPVRWLAAVMLLAPFLGVGVATSYWFFERPFPGLFLGLGAYLVVILFVMIGDIVAINRELAAFRNGEDLD